MQHLLACVCGVQTAVISFGVPADLTKWKPEQQERCDGHSLRQTHG